MTVANLLNIAYHKLVPLFGRLHGIAVRGSMTGGAHGAALLTRGGGAVHFM